MAFTSSALVGEPRSMSIGPVKIQILNIACATGDTSGTVVADRLSTVFGVAVCSGLKLTGQPTITGNSCALAFADPVATVAGLVICIGR